MSALIPKRNFKIRVQESKYNFVTSTSRLQMSCKMFLNSYLRGLDIQLQLVTASVVSQH
jgi:hypothetical protein